MAIIDDTTEITVQELRTIVQGIKMAGLGFIEEGAIDEIKAMIKALPSAEEINKMTTTPNAIKRLQRDLGNIMRFIEIYGKRDKEFKTRYKTRTGLPPRYKVLDWRCDMKCDMDLAARDFVRELIKVSEHVDNQGRGQISGSLIKCARKVQDNTPVEDDITQVVNDLRKAGFERESALIQEAQLQWMKDMWQGVKNVGQGVGQAVQNVGQGAKEMYQVGKYKSALDGINKQIEKVMQGVLQAAQTAQNPERQAALQGISQKMNYMLGIGKELLEVVEEEEANEVAPTAASEVAPTAASEVAPTSATPQFQVGQAVIYKGKPSSVVKVFPQYGTVQLKDNTGRVFAVDFQELINENPVGTIPQVKTPVTSPATSPATSPVSASSKKFNLKKFSK